MFSVVLAAPALAGVFDGVLCAATLSPSKCGKITDQIFSTNGCCEISSLGRAGVIGL